MSRVGVLLVVAGCGGSGATIDAPGPPPIDAAPPRCTPIGGTNLAVRQIAVTDTMPVLVTSPPGDDRLFVVEKPGTIRILRDGVAVDPPFLDLQMATGGPVIDVEREQGLLGLVFHPDYATNRRFYVFHTQRRTYNWNILAEYTTRADDPDHADRETLRELLAIRDFATNHNGGMLAFDRDGYLVIGTGDGGSGGDPMENGQDPNELLAKLLRIDVDTQGATTPYGIPPGNPYVQGGGAPEVLAIGLRNPWRWSFDPVTWDIYIGDVGQSRREEIDVVSADALPGTNFGWREREGKQCRLLDMPCETAGMTDPVLDMAHGPPDLACAVIGGVVYRGSCYPDLVGRYFFTDLCLGTIRSFRYENGVVVDLTTHAATVDRPTSLHADAFGELYVTTEGGRIYAVEVTP